MMQNMKQLAQQEQAQFWRVPEYGDLEMLSATYITHQFALHYHEEYVIGVVDRGHYRFWSRGAMRKIYANEIVFINPGEIHSGQANDAHGWRYRTLYPSVTLMRRIIHDVVGKEADAPLFNSPIVSDPTLARRFLNMHRCLQHSSSQLERDTLLIDTLSTVVRRHASNSAQGLQLGAERAAIRQACDYIHAHYDENIALSDLAQVVGFSPYYLSRVFKQEMGLPPHKYLTMVRVNRARHLLSAGIDIAVVAAMVGFVDQSHLSRWFKRVVGVPPGQFRAAAS